MRSFFAVISIALFFAFIFVMATKEKNLPLSEYNQTSGIVEDYKIEREDSSRIYIFLEFEDRIVKLRSRYSHNLTIPKDVGITVYYDDDACIHKIVKDE